LHPPWTDDPLVRTVSGVTSPVAGSVCPETIKDGLQSLVGRVQEYQDIHSLRTSQLPSVASLPPAIGTGATIARPQNSPTRRVASSSPERQTSPTTAWAVPSYTPSVTPPAPPYLSGAPMATTPAVFHGQLFPQGTAVPEGQGMSVAPSAGSTPRFEDPSWHARGAPGGATALSVASSWRIPRSVSVPPMRMGNMVAVATAPTMRAPTPPPPPSQPPPVLQSAAMPRGSWLPSGGSGQLVSPQFAHQMQVGLATASRIASPMPRSASASGFGSVMPGAALGSRVAVALGRPSAMGGPPPPSVSRSRVVIGSSGP